MSRRLTGQSGHYPPAIDTAVKAAHLIAAVAFAGGLIFIGIAATVAKRTLDERSRIEFFRVLGQRFAILGAAALAVLIGTGSYLAARRLPSFSDLFDTAFGRRLSEKLALVALVIALTVVHAAIQGPRLRRLRQRALEMPDDTSLQAEIRSKQIASGIVSAALLVATLAIIVLAAGL